MADERAAVHGQAPSLDQNQERIDAAAAALLIELAFLLPRGTDLHTHPISEKLLNYRKALLQKGEAPGQAPPLARVDLSTGRFFLEVAGVVVAVEADPCRDPNLPVAAWDRASLNTACQQINRGGQAPPSPPPFSDPFAGRHIGVQAPPSPPPESPPREWLIVEGRHSLWWRADRCGYTSDIGDAGLYTEEEAKRIERGRREPPDRAMHVSTQRDKIATIAAGVARLQAALESRGVQGPAASPSLPFCAKCGRLERQHGEFGFRDHAYTAASPSRFGISENIIVMPKEDEAASPSTQSLTREDLELIASVFTDYADEARESADPDRQHDAPTLRALSRKAAILAFDLQAASPSTGEPK